MSETRPALLHKLRNSRPGIRPGVSRAPSPPPFNSGRRPAGFPLQSLSRQGPYGNLRMRERLKWKSRRECRLGRASGSEPDRPKRKSIPEEFAESVPHYVAVRFFWNGKRGMFGKKRRFLPDMPALLSAHFSTPLHFASFLSSPLLSSPLLSSTSFDTRRAPKLVFLAEL